jgi:hypothetical protein
MYRASQARAAHPAAETTWVANERRKRLGQNGGAAARMPAAVLLDSRNRLN